MLSYATGVPLVAARLRPASERVRARWERIALAMGHREIEAWAR